MTPTHLGLALLINLIWGYNAVASKVGVEALPPLLLTSMRFLGVLVLLAPFLKWKRGEMGAIFAVAVLGGILNFGLSFMGVALSNASLYSVLNQLNAPFATILSIVFLKEHVGWRRWLGIAIAFAGVVYLSFDSNVAAYWAGALLTAGAALSMAFAQIIMRRLRDVAVFELQAWIALVSCPALFLASLAMEHGQWHAVQSAHWSIWATLVYQILGASLIGQGGMYFLLRRYDVALVTSLLLLSPVLGVVFGVWLLDEPMTVPILIGSALTLTGVFIIALRQRRTEIVAIAPAQGAIEPLPAFAAEGGHGPVAEPAAKS